MVLIYSCNGLGSDQRPRPLHWVDLILLVWYCLHLKWLWKGGDKIFPNPSLLVVAFSNLIHENGHYVASMRFASYGVCVERSLAKRDNWNPKMSPQAVK